MGRPVIREIASDKTSHPVTVTTQIELIKNDSYLVPKHHAILLVPDNMLTVELS